MAKKTVINTKSETNATISPAEKATLVIPNTGRLEQAEVNKDGINIKQALGALKLVDIADVDLLLTFANGERIVIPNGALEAVSSAPPTATFHDQKIALPELLKYVGLTYQAKPGSLRLVSENIDANPPSDINTTDREPTPITPPPAPIVKVSPGTGVGKGLANGLGDVPDTYVPLVTAQPSVYRIGASPSTPINELIKGAPNFDVNLFTSNEFKLSPSGRINAPLGAFVNDANPQELVARSNPANQATREVINGTSGADNIVHNANFALDSQWAKSIHATISNISPTQPITISIDQAKLALMSGFDLVGTGITHVAGSNTWSIDPTLITATGFDFKIVYDIDTRINPVTVNFVADVNIKGTSGPFSLDYTKPIYFTYRDVDANTADFTVTDPLTGKQMFVLPSKGLGVDIRAGAGDDLITAGAGNDWINGGEGSDTINGGIGQDTIKYDTSSASVQVDLRSTTAQTSTGDALGDILSNIENVTGSIYDDRLTGSQVSNILKGLNGNDILVSIGSNNTLDGGNGTDTASFEFNDNGIDASLRTNTSSNGDKLVSIENLTGSSFDDTLEGNAGANHFDGDDHQANGDTVSYANAPVVANTSNVGVVASLSGYTFTNFSSAQSAVVATGDAVGDTFANIENLTGSAFNDTLIGDASSNTLKGGAGNDIFEGLAGADRLIGDSGTDTASYAFADASVTADLSGLFVAANLQQGDAQGDTFDSMENLTGSKFNDTLIGDSNANTINSGDGDDVLEGLGGADTFIGGEGTDTATYINSSGAVRASLTNNLSFFDSAGDAIGDTFNGIENLTGSSFSDALFGNSGANIINGGDGSDFLQGLGGGDSYIGGSGIDSVSYARANDNTGVIANLLTGQGTAGFANGDTYNSIENLIGTNWDDQFTGDNNANNLTGGLGNDILRGNGGADNISGGDGDDEIYDDLNGATIIDAGAGKDKVYLRNSDTSTDSISGGDGLEDTLIWQDGRSLFFDMTSGSVDMVGATAQTKLNAFENFTNEATFANASNGWSSWIRVSNIDNVITGHATRVDIVDFSTSTAAVYANIGTNSFTATGVAGIDTTTQTVAGQVARGGSGNDTLLNIDSLIGSSSNDVLIGNSGVNWLNGGAGNDRLYGFEGNDILEGGTGNDYLEAGDGNDSLLGGDGNDTLLGGAGNDTLDGGAGADTINGGSDNDTVTYASSSAVNITFSNANTAMGAGGQAQGDQLSNIENIIGSASNDSFTLVANTLPTTINGGDGSDTIKLSGLTSSLYDLTPVAILSTSIETIDIRDGVANNLGLSEQDIVTLLDRLAGSTGLPTLTILANSSDTITLDAGFTWAQSFNSGVSTTYNINNSSNTAVAAITWQVA